jgi:hypothetical protein
VSFSVCVGGGGGGNDGGGRGGGIVVEDNFSSGTILSNFIFIYLLIYLF